MPIYEITAPDGVTYEIEAPEGATEAQALEHFKTQYTGSGETATPEQAPPEEEYERNWFDTPRAALQGLTMGWSDELGAGAGAGLAKTMQLFNDDKTPIGDIYDQMKGNIDAEREAYKTAHPVENFALNVGGGLLTGGAGSGKVMATQAFKNASKLKKALMLAGTGSAEGSIAGAGSAKEDERLRGAAIGGTVGAAIPLALSGAGAVGGELIKRRIKPDMVDDAGNFLPINQVTPTGSPLGNIYQKLIAPSFGGQKLREQNMGVLERAVRASDVAEDAILTAKTTGKQTDDAQLRNLIQTNALPSNASGEVKQAVREGDGHQAVSEINKAWKKGFDMVKGREFDIDPQKLVDDVVTKLDTPTSKDFTGTVLNPIKNKISQGFTASTKDPDVKFTSKGFGSEKTPPIELSTGKVDGASLMQARNQLRIQASELKDEGGGALQRSALNQAADEIDTLIRNSLDGDELTAFNQELKSWGNNQLNKRATISAGTNQQGLYEPQQALQAARTNQNRNFGAGDAPFQTQAQALQVKQADELTRLAKESELANAALKDVKSKAPDINPAPWSKTVSTAVLGGTPLAALPIDPATKAALVMPFGYTLGKIGSTEGVQKTIAGQTGIQKYLAELLRKHQGSTAQQALQAGQGVLTREAIMNMTGE